jgi:hypothetical protein
MDFVVDLVCLRKQKDRHQLMAFVSSENQRIAQRMLDLLTFILRGKEKNKNERNERKRTKMKEKTNKNERKKRKKKKKRNKRKR